MWKRFRNEVEREDGSSLIEVALLLMPLLLLLVGAVDYGRAYYIAMEVSTAAESGALYGSLNPTDSTGMISAAKLDAKDVSGLSATAVHGCECSDGTGASANCATVPTCSANVVDYVEVDTSATYTPLFGAGSTMSLTGKGRMRSNY